MALPNNKFTAWSEAIEIIISRMTTSAKEMEQNIGQLVHLGFVLLAIYHFLSQLQDLQWQAENRRSIPANTECAKDLLLMLWFLQKAREGIDLNLIAYRKPNKAYRSDSYPHGLNGYINKGLTLRHILLARGASLPSFKQPVRSFGCNHHSLDQDYDKQAQGWRLLPPDDG